MRAYLKKYKTIFTLFAALAFILPTAAISQAVRIDAMNLLSHVEVSPSPRSGSFEEGSTFDVPILLNTKGSSINGIEVRVHFDKDKLSIISQSNGTSIIGIWVEPPRYDNTNGTASYVGVVPNGVTTGSGFIGNITFKALRSGQATVGISSGSRILLNDGLGTDTIVDSGRAVYTIFPKAPEGVRIYSETHPFQDSWYNNNSPVVSWDAESGVDAFSYHIDNKPGTIPDNVEDGKDTTVSFENKKDGLWYFHIKARKAGIWGTTGQFLMRIDTAPPADFKPEASYLMAAAALVERTLVSFFTTDNLSGVDHYEVGIIDKTQPPTESPVFVQAESPFQVPNVKDGQLRIMVRAIDKAGNIRDAFVDADPPDIVGKFMNDYLLYLLLLIILAGLLAFIIHYLFGHHILKRLRQAFSMAKRDDQAEEITKENRESKID
ncbi:MAG: cohesin domain-containing protein [Candidatus Paceibacterota bacterium]|jgi:hypothetical protein|nr:cohesin domain-containing protein [Candidatus Paceibacterota bacterium]